LPIIRAGQRQKLEARLADIEPTGAVEGPAAKAATELDDLRARLADSEAVHARAVAQATAMQQAAAALRDERDAVRQELVAAQGAVAALRRDVATAEAARAEDAGSAAREIVDLRTALSVRDAEVARLQARVAAAEVAARTATAPVPEPGRETGQGSAQAPVSAVNPETGRDDSPDAIVSVTAAPRGNATVADGVLAYQGGDYDAAFAIWQPLAVQGNARAQFHLGALYFEGRGVVRDTVLARRWLGRAVEGGWAPAENLLTQLDTAAR
ncbi:MAG: hypothetical protein VW644_01610, partial [Alphaproteobacteria bacterium]